MLPFTQISPTGEQATALSRTNILERIRVKPPYYALQNERMLGATFCAEATADLAQHRAAGAMRAGEVSRHGAIAGSCALALAQKDAAPRFYLATQASYTGYPVAADYGVAVTFEAEVRTLGRRQATATVRAHIGGQLLAELEVTYSVVNPAIFARLNGDRRQNTLTTDTLRPLVGYPVSWRDNVGVCTVPNFPLGTCAGHFDEYPAAPVALLMDQLGYVVDSSLARAAYVAEVEVSADQLCWAGEEVSFTMEKCIDDSEQARFEGGIESNGTTIGTMKLRMQYDAGGTLSVDRAAWSDTSAAEAPTDAVTSARRVAA